MQLRYVQKHTQQQIKFWQNLSNSSASKKAFAGKKFDKCGKRGIFAQFVSKQ